MIRAERAAGNLMTGVFQFSNFALKSGLFYCVGESAERFFDGTVKVHKARFTTCEYIQDDHDHYAIAAIDATIEPRDYNSSLFNYDGQLGDHSILMKNNFFQIYGIPVLWLPVLYKPSDLSSFGGKIEFGSTSEWGWYIRSAKHFKLTDDPYWNMNLMLDWYENRGIGYGVDQARFERYWTSCIHLIGKDILTTHSVYWPTMLKAIGLPMPKTIFAHGWWLTGSRKMSKSLGNVVNPMDMADKYGVDAFRYFLLAAMTPGNDASFTEEDFLQRFNTDLANDLGNLLSRVVKLSIKNFGGTLPAPPPLQPLELELLSKEQDLVDAGADSTATSPATRTGISGTTARCASIRSTCCTIPSKSGISTSSRGRASG